MQVKPVSYNTCQVTWHTDYRDVKTRFEDGTKYRPNLRGNLQGDLSGDLGLMASTCPV